MPLRGLIKEILLTLLFLSLLDIRWEAIAGKLPEVSSTLLRMHRQYTRQPPHDTALYDVLQVQPNATTAQIQKSYRRLSRKYHPDKQHGENTERQHVQSQFDQIREAYEILKDDSTRLPYHRYGLVNTVHAIYILRGRFQEALLKYPGLVELVQLMGYTLEQAPPPPPPRIAEDSSQSTSPLSESLRNRQEHQQRVRLMAHTIMGTIRPFIEESVDEQFLADRIVAQCDRLKKLPMGAQIIRCIGRAYRYSGRRLLRLYYANPKKFGVDESSQNRDAQRLKSLPAVWGVSDRIRDQLWRVDHVMKAAVASGRVMFSERKQKRLDKEVGNTESDHGEDDHFQNLHNFGDMDAAQTDDQLSVGELSGSILPEESDFRNEERRKAQKALLESLQIEALWKICKIDLDRTVREACDLLLTGKLFFHSDLNGREDGWVGSSGYSLSSDIARVRAAASLVMIGNIMVQRSKEGTAWVE